MPSMKLGDTALIVAECRKRGLLRNQCAYVLATAYHETAHTMKPVRETLAKSDAQAKAVLSRAWETGKLGQVKRDYWSDGWFGRGYVQLTHEKNYAKAGKALGVDLVGNPGLALEPTIAAKILVVGMMTGLFTTKRLDTYVTADKSNFVAARRVVNGSDRAQAIANLAKDYDLALRVGGYDAAPAKPEPEPAAPNAMLKRGDTGKYVEDLQRNLIALGYSLTVTGTFDERTEAAVEAFQTKHGLLVDGKAGIRTNTKIGEALKALETKPQIEAAKKEIPKTVEKIVKEKTSWLSKIVALITSSGIVSSLGINNWFDSDWTTILAWIGGILGAGVILVLLFLLLGSQVMAKIDEINSRQKE
jgi:predicted chitinase